ncbi:MAG: LytTR family DNA-binding domain-containing protein [Reichenbachiella sp.]|uniref:LytR/AlgR family response regulator transcription factor n=2 Tax=Reichenbachiella sp. TaxID=2184521 RepID=UPI00326711C9
MRESEYLGKMTIAAPERKKYLSALLIWLAVLFGMALFQNYLRYGHSEKYDVWNSVIYLCITIILFFPFGLLAINRLLNLKAEKSLPLWKIALIAIGTIAMHYISGTVVMHVLGFYDSFFEIKFARQYFGREAFFHLLSLMALTYFVFQRMGNVRMVSGSIGRKELTLQANTISWIEADDHYLKIYAGDFQMVKRATLEKMTEELRPDFIRIHRRYLVNRKQIVGKEKQQRDEFVVLASGQRLKVGRSYAPLEI